MGRKRGLVGIHNARFRYVADIADIPLVFEV
jgi:hypothetical protein